MSLQGGIGNPGIRGEGCFRTRTATSFKLYITDRKTKDFRHMRASQEKVSSLLLP